MAQAQVGGPVQSWSSAGRRAPVAVLCPMGPYHYGLYGSYMAPIWLLCNSVELWGFSIIIIIIILPFIIPWTYGGFP